jgi:hypothetical protein
VLIGNRTEINGEKAMRTKNGIEIPETIGEARKMNFKDLEKACEEFNKHGMNVEDIQREWDKRWKDGFETAENLIMKILCDSSWASEDICSQVEDVVKEYKRVKLI